MAVRIFSPLGRYGRFESAGSVFFAFSVPDTHEVRFGLRVTLGGHCSNWDYTIRWNVSFHAQYLSFDCSSGQDQSFSTASRDS
jgi:hypothetical protein